MAHERHLLQERLGLGDLLVEREKDGLLLLIERGVGVPREDREEKPDDGQEVLDELGVILLQDAECEKTNDSMNYYILRKHLFRRNHKIESIQLSEALH